MFRPRLALASLSGESDAGWARAGAPYAGAAFLGGIAVCPRTRAAAREMVARGRTEFLPRDPLTFLDEQLTALTAVPIRPGVNLRAMDRSRLRAAAAVCATHDAIAEVNAHCRQAEMCSAGAGETLLGDPDRLAAQVGAAVDGGATVSVKVRTEVDGVDLVETARTIADAGASAIHIDAMDSEAVVGRVAEATELFVIANNGVRDRRTVDEYFAYGADAVSVGRPSDRPAVLARVQRAVTEPPDASSRGTQPRTREATSPPRGPNDR